MRLILVPHSATTTDANLWLCANDVTAPPADFTLTIEKVRDETIRKSDWKPVTVGSLREADTQTYVQVKNIKGLQPRTEYNAVAGVVRATFATLPAELPREGENPFTVLLASCFYVGNDRAPLIGAAVAGLRPDLKILCGDQVYLDVPEVTFLPLGEKALSSLFLSKYLRNWNDETGYQVLLKSASSYFTADDHEFWNNHPNRAVHIPDTWTQGGRDRIADRALQLYKAFQCETDAKAGRLQKFNVGRLSFCIADTRIFRKPGSDQFMLPADLQDLVNWVKQLQGPGVIVVGQPLFDKSVSFLKQTFVDRVLPDYKQYETLVKAISESKFSLVILTGDVHFSRVSSAVFRAGGSAEIIEVIASPTAVVAGAPGKLVPAPERFPHDQISGVTGARTVTQSKDGSIDNNFATLEFVEASGHIKMKVQHFYIRKGKVLPDPGQFLDIPLF
jgi:phosphodiesterase/alkaline phosphatase D-like protein